MIYLVLGVAQRFGETSFYHPIEHLIFVLYGASSYLSCCLCSWFLQHKSRLKSVTAIQLGLSSALCNAVLTTLLFLLIRFLLSDNKAIEYWWPPFLGLVANVVYTFATIHIPVLALVLSLLFMQQSHNAKLQQVSAEKEALYAQLQLMQQQITPHFLFNSLNVLNALIEAEPRLAQRYVSLFSSLYRFTLTHREQLLIPLQEELEFVHSYIELMNIRSQGAYQLNLSAALNQSKEWIPPAALQSCIENAIKHNKATAAQPLSICIEAEENWIVISQPLRLKNNPEPSTGTGLENLKRRYQTLAGRSPQVSSDHEFIVRLPRLAQSKEDSADEIMDS